jgi:hypothetical protein
MWRGCRRCSWNPKRIKKECHCCSSPAYLIQKPALWIWMVTCQCPFPYQTPQVSAIFSTVQHVTHLSGSYPLIIHFLLFFGQPLNYVSFLNLIASFWLQRKQIACRFPFLRFLLFFLLYTHQSVTTLKL